MPPLPTLPSPLQAASLPGAQPVDRAQRHLALDGKTLRGSRRSGNVVQPAVHLLSLYDVIHQGTLAQVEVATKDHEIPGATTLIDVALLFGGVWSAWLEQRTATTVDQGHGRLEVRQLRASTELNEYLAERWVDVAQVFAIEREIVRHGKETHEVVYDITSLPTDVGGPGRVLEVVRQLWHLENRVHWRRDVTLGEDGCQVKERTAAQVLAALNNAVLMLMDHLGVENVKAQMREFAAYPLTAVALLFNALLWSFLLKAFTPGITIMLTYGATSHYR